MAQRRILLAEDNEINSEITKELLEENGYVVDTVDNGADAVKAVEESESGYYFLVLMDIQMPFMDGYEATARIRELKDSVNSSIPIFAMTANAFDKDRQASYAVGMNEHLVKPIDVDNLMNTIEKYI